MYIISPFILLYFTKFCLTFLINIYYKVSLFFSDSFVTEDTDLNYVGINHYLSNNGAKLIKDIEEDYGCIILEKNKSETESNADSLENSTGLGSSINPIASAQMHNYKVIFLQGSPLDIQVDAVINFIDRNGNSLDDPGKEIMLRGSCYFMQTFNYFLNNF